MKKNDSKEKVLLGLKSGISFSFNLAVTIANIFINIIFLLGVVGVLILLYKTYPETALIIFSAIAPIFSILWIIFIYTIFALEILILSWILFKIILIVDKYIEKRKEIKEEEYKKLIAEIAKEIKRKK